MKKLDEISIEVVDILEEMKVLNNRISETVCTNMTDEQKKCYYLGVQNTMNALESIIHLSDKVEDRLIYQKNGVQSDVVRYTKLSNVFDELYGGD